MTQMISLSLSLEYEAFGSNTPSKTVLDALDFRLDLVPVQIRESNLEVPDSQGELC